MKKGDLVRVSFPTGALADFNDLIGIVVEFFPNDEHLQYEIGVPLYEAICVVLIEGAHAFFYESELILLNDESEKE
jgi:hypothetical protein